MCLDALARYTDLARTALTEESDPWSAFSRFMHQAIAGGAGAVLPVIVGRIPVTEQLQSAGDQYTAADRADLRGATKRATAQRHWCR